MPLVLVILLVGSGIISFDIFGTSTIVINSFEMAHELLEKRSLIYSDRYILLQTCCIHIETHCSSEAPYAHDE